MEHHARSPFDYDLHISRIEGTNGRVMICFHGYGDGYEIGAALKSFGCVKSTLISFNFPDYRLHERVYDYRKATFGTIRELLPPLYVMKQVVIDGGIDKIDLYGFSAGGGALVNTIGVLNTSTYDADLEKIGIKAAEKKVLLNAIQKGVVLLDVPLKSIEEVMEFRGPSKEFEVLAQNYRANDLRPIDSLKRLEGLSLNILLHFQEDDEILSNRDDLLYIQRLKEVQDQAMIIIDDDGGHLSPHLSLWKAYNKKIS
jgi:hypothetical protein